MDNALADGMERQRCTALDGFHIVGGLMAVPISCIELIGLRGDGSGCVAAVQGISNGSMAYGTGESVEHGERQSVIDQLRER